MNEQDPNKQPIGRLIFSNLEQLIRDVIAPIRIVLTTAIIYVSFFFLGQLASLALNWMFRGLRARLEFVDQLLDGFETAVLLVAVVFGLIDAIQNVRLIRSISRKLERRDLSNEDPLPIK